MLPLLFPFLLSSTEENIEELARQAYLDSQKTAIVAEDDSTERIKFELNLESKLEPEYKMKYPFKLYHSASYPVRNHDLITEQELILRVPDFSTSLLMSLNFKNGSCISFGSEYSKGFFDQNDDKLDVHGCMSQKPTENTEVYSRLDYRYEPYSEKKSNYSLNVGMKIKL